MAQYVVHKIGFWYTDDGYEIGDEKGNVMAITKSLEEAQSIKQREDIISLKGLYNDNPVVFYLERDNYQEIDKKMVAYYESEFDLTINHNARYYEFPKQISDEQALQFLSIMELTFHNIVEYGDDEVINPADYKFDEGGSDYIGF
jgi:hypothetical protein